MDGSIIDKLALISLSDGQILMTLTKGKETYYIPGGKREQGETDVEALTREVREELGVELKQETIQLYGVFEAQAHGRPLGTMVRMSCYTAEMIGEPKPCSEIAALGNYTYADRSKVGPVDQIILDDLHQKGLLK